MKTSDVDMKKLLPLFMRDDNSTLAIADIVNEIFSYVDAPRLRTWDQMEKLTHEELDALADELNVLWYNQAGSLAEKREQIKTSDDVWRTLGTPHAIEMVISQLFINGKLLEFWEYGGEPHHFIVECYDPSVLTPDGEKEFRRIIELVKRKSQVLDSIRLVLAPQFFEYTGVVIRDLTVERHEFIS